MEVGGRDDKKVNLNNDGDNREYAHGSLQEAIVAISGMQFSDQKKVLADLMAAQKSFQEGAPLMERFEPRTRSR